MSAVFNYCSIQFLTSFCKLVLILYTEFLTNITLIVIEIHNYFVAGFSRTGGTRAMLKILGLDSGQPRLPMTATPQHKVDQLKKDLTNIGFFEWGVKK